MDIALIAAVADNDVIGDNGDIPWSDEDWAKKDLKHFRDTTMHHPVVMGRNTYESLPDEYTPLPGRYNIVLSTTLETEGEKVAVADSIDTALEKAETYLDGREEDTVYGGGGRNVYGQFLNEDLVDELIITEIHEPYPGDTTFPWVDWRVWEEHSREEHDAFDFVTYKRRETR